MGSGGAENVGGLQRVVQCRLQAADCCRRRAGLRVSKAGTRGPLLTVQQAAAPQAEPQGCGSAERAPQRRQLPGLLAHQAGPHRCSEAQRSLRPGLPPAPTGVGVHVGACDHEGWGHGTQRHHPSPRCLTQRENQGALSGKVTDSSHLGADSQRAWWLRGWGPRSWGHTPSMMWGQGQGWGPSAHMHTSVPVWRAVEGREGQRPRVFLNCTGGEGSCPRTCHGAGGGGSGDFVKLKDTQDRCMVSGPCPLAGLRAIGHAHIWRPPRLV